MRNSEAPVSHLRIATCVKISSPACWVLQRDVRAKNRPGTEVMSIGKADSVSQIQVSDQSHE